MKKEQKNLDQLQQKREELLSLLKENELALAELDGNADKNILQLPKRIDEELVDHIQQLDEKRNSVIDTDFSISGFKELDKITGGFKKNDFVIIGARPGMSKTALLLSIILNDLSKSKKNVLYFSIEMTKKQTLNKLLSYETAVPYLKINNGTLKKSEWERFESNIENLRNLPLFIDDTPSINLYDLIAKCKQMKQAHNVSLVYIDSLQQITLTEKQRRKASSMNVLNVVCETFKDLIKTDDITIIATSQLARSVETRGGAKRPMLFDLKGSSELEESADTIIMLYRPEVYGIRYDEDGLDLRGIAELIVAKNKFGIKDTVKIKYIEKLDKFEEFTQQDIDYNKGMYDRPFKGFDDDEDNDDDVPF